MAHAHAHAHAHVEGEGTYFLDQLFTILACGAVGLVAILMYQTGFLGRILVPMFFPMVVAGGSAILLMALVRGIAVWQLAGARRAAEADAINGSMGHGHEHGHSHSHGEAAECGHDHSHGAAEHGHAHVHDHGNTQIADDEGHDHGWAPWRYMVIAIPVFLYFLGLPREGLTSNEVKKNMAGTLQQGSARKSLALLAGGLALPKTQPRRLQLRFKELSEAAALPMRHEIYEGDIGVLRGQFAPRGEREFSLFRVNMTCCAADAVFLETRIIAPDSETIRNIAANQWVQVEGVISFQQNEKGKWIPVITMQSNDAIDPNADSTTDVNSF
jgi:hypothetical protein